MNDDVLLQQELSHQFFYRTSDDDFEYRHAPRAPSGARVIDGIGMLIGLVELALILKAVGNVQDFGAAAVVLLVGLAWALAPMVARRIWVALGPTLRGLLRPLGRGVIVLVVLLAIGGGVAVQIVSGLAGGKSLTEVLAGGPLTGPGFAALADGPAPRVVSYRDAVDFCASLDGGFRLPHEGDEAQLAAAVTNFALRKKGLHAEGDGSLTFEWNDHFHAYRLARANAPIHTPRAFAVCVAP